jgi:hypothetical protein
LLGHVLLCLELAQGSLDAVECISEGLYSARVWINLGILGQESRSAVFVVEHTLERLVVPPARINVFRPLGRSLVQELGIDA